MLRTKNVLGIVAAAASVAAVTAHIQSHFVKTKMKTNEMK